MAPARAMRVPGHSSSLAFFLRLVRLLYPLDGQVERYLVFAVAVGYEYIENARFRCPARVDDFELDDFAPEFIREVLCEFVIEHSPHVFRCGEKVIVERRKQFGECGILWNRHARVVVENIVESGNVGRHHFLLFELVVCRNVQKAVLFLSHL